MLQILLSELSKTHENYPFSRTDKFIQVLGATKLFSTLVAIMKY